MKRITVTNVEPQQPDMADRIETLENMLSVLWQNGIKANKRLSDIEEFLGDI